MVAHYEAAELQPRALEAPRGVVPQAYGGVVVFEVRRHGAGADVAPLAYHGIAKEAVVGLVGIGLEHHIVELAAHLAPGPYGGAGVDFRAHIHHGVAAHGYGAAQHRALHHLRVGAYVHRPGGGVDEGAFYLRAFGYEDVVGRPYHRVGGAQRLRDAASEGREVGLDGVAVVEEYVVEMRRTPHFAGVFHIAGCAVAAACQYCVAGAEGMAFRKRLHGLDNGGVGYHVGRHTQGVLAVGRARTAENAFEIFHLRLYRGIAARETSPLLGQSVDTHTQGAHRAGVCQRQQLATHTVKVAYYHLFAHIMYCSCFNAANLAKSPQNGKSRPAKKAMNSFRYFFDKGNKHTYRS